MWLELKRLGLKQLVKASLANILASFAIIVLRI